MIWTVTSRWALLFALVAALTACKQAQEPDGEQACQKLLEAREQLELRLQELELVAEELPSDPISGAEELEIQLTRFGEIFKAVNRDITAMHTAHEPSCKAPLVESDRFDQVYDKVYQPYIEIIGRQYEAVMALVTVLERHPDSPPLVELAQSYREVAEELQIGLHTQVVVCESDFDRDRCERFRKRMEGVMQNLAEPTRKPTETP